MRPHYARVAARAGHRCEYCHAPEAVFNAPFEVEHIRPESRGGLTSMANLALACRHCNVRKGSVVCAGDRMEWASSHGFAANLALFNPRKHRWQDNFEVREFEIVGLTETGRFTVLLLSMNAPRVVEARRHWAKLGLFP